MKANGLIWLIFISSSVFAEFRTWTATDGQTVEAEFLLRSIKSVRLKTQVGKTLNVSFDRLSRQDQIYVELHSPPVLSVEVEPNENHVGESVNHQDREGYLILDFEITVRKKSRMSYSRPLKLDLYIIGMQEVTGRFIVLQHHSSRMVFDNKRNTKIIKASQLVLTQSSEAVITESDYHGYLLVITDDRGERIVILSNRKIFESRATFLGSLRTGSTFARRDLEGPAK